jgi:uncharacterized membrane protein YdfJ with MMPL/SSD domain
MSSARHLTGAAGRWSATHPWTAILAWLGCVVVLLLTPPPTAGQPPRRPVTVA